ncbi:glucan endo-1,3-beta-glucosidase 8-like protein [Tanacetum coccineum]
MASHKMNPDTIVEIMKDNEINKVNLSENCRSTMSALATSGIEVMIAVPNDQLEAMNDSGRAKKFVQRNLLDIILMAVLTLGKARLVYR